MHDPWSCLFRFCFDPDEVSVKQGQDTSYFYFTLSISVKSGKQWKCPAPGVKQIINFDLVDFNKTFLLNFNFLEHFPSSD